jgi:hypothetical protein
MQGLILFADDKIHHHANDEKKTQSAENRLYQNLSKIFPVVGIGTLDGAIETIHSLGLLDVLIVDWNFEDPESIELTDSEEGIPPLPPRITTAEEFLSSPEIYSLIYIYSSAASEIEQGPFQRLKEIHGDRIHLIDKDNLQNTEEETKRIKNHIEQLRNNRATLNIPFEWSKTINKAMNGIFHDLQDADPNWIAELYRTHKRDSEPSREVIKLFHNLLSEKVLSDEDLLKRISEHVETSPSLENISDFAKLIHFVIFGLCKEADPILTGDIFRDTTNPDKYYIVITPECDAKYTSILKNDANWEVLSFSKSGFSQSPFRLNLDPKSNDLITWIKDNTNTEIDSNQRGEINTILKATLLGAQSEALMQSFNQPIPRFHTIPCFQFEPANHTGLIEIDFKTSFTVLHNTQLLKENRVCKLNSPFIQELRQRYHSYKGRVGVPAYSELLRNWILQNKQ